MTEHERELRLQRANGGRLFPIAEILLDTIDAERIAHAADNRSSQAVNDQLRAELNVIVPATEVLRAELEAERAAHAETKARLGEVERERDELRAEYDDRERRARRQERDLMRESQDARLATLTATLREVRDFVAEWQIEHWRFCSASFGPGGRCACNGPALLARCDAVLKETP